MFFNIKSIFSYGKCNLEVLSTLVASLGMEKPFTRKTEPKAILFYIFKEIFQIT